MLELLPPAIVPPMEFLSAAELNDLESILDAAVAWSDKHLPITEFAKVGWIVSPATNRESAAYSRYLAMWDAVKRSDTRLPHLKRAIDALIRFEGFQITNHGIFSAADLAGTNVVVMSR